LEEEPLEKNSEASEVQAACTCHDNHCYNMSSYLCICVLHSATL
jgi:hypothetical protein